MAPGYVIYPGAKMAPGYVICPGAKMAPGYVICPGAKMAPGYVSSIAAAPKILCIVKICNPMILQLLRFVWP
jgi:hypothetical protein